MWSESLRRCINVEMPGEKIVSTMIEQITAGILLKISQNDEIKNREFLFKMKELEFYKSNFEKDLKDIFNNK